MISKYKYVIIEVSSYDIDFVKLTFKRIEPIYHFDSGLFYHFTLHTGRKISFQFNNSAPFWAYIRVRNFESISDSRGIFFNVNSSEIDRHINFTRSSITNIEALALYLPLEYGTWVLFPKSLLGILYESLMLFKSTSGNTNSYSFSYSGINPPPNLWVI